MPAVSGVTRRTLLRSLGGAATVFTLGAQSQDSIKLALLADTHVAADPEAESRGFRPYSNLVQAAAEIAPSKPDAIFIAGDLARLEGTAADYVTMVKGLAPLQLTVPVAYCLGNHDDRLNFTRVLAPTAHGKRHGVKDKFVLVVESGPIRFVLLDSLIVPNETPGFLGKAQRTWLDEYLGANTDRPTAIFVHHTLDDGDNSLLDSDRLLRLAARHPHVKAIFYGHSHVYKYDTYEGVHLVNLPALGYNFSDSQPVGWINGSFTQKGATLTLRAIGGNTAGDGKTQTLAWRR